MLEFLGYHVDLAEHGQQAVEAVSTQRYDLVFMDCQMPVLDGFAATAAIRRHEASIGTGHHIPIIALTANAMEGDRGQVPGGWDGRLPFKAFFARGLASRSPTLDGDETTRTPACTSGAVRKQDHPSYSVRAFR